MILYHWSPRSNRQSIARVGLSPTRALGKKQVVWACNRHNVGWALCHAAARHGYTPDEFMLIEVSVHHSLVRKTRWKGVYTCRTGYSPEQITSVRRGLLCDPEPLTAAGGTTDVRA